MIDVEIDVDIFAIGSVSKTQRLGSKKFKYFFRSVTPIVQKSNVYMF